MDPVAAHLEKLKAYAVDADRRVPHEPMPRIYQAPPIPDMSGCTRAFLCRLGAVLPNYVALAAELTALADAVHWRLRIRTYRMLADRTHGAVLEELERQVSGFPGNRPGTGGNRSGTAREPESCRPGGPHSVVVDGKIHRLAAASCPRCAAREPTFREQAEEAQRKAQERGLK